MLFIFSLFFYKAYKNKDWITKESLKEATAHKNAIKSKKGVVVSLTGLSIEKSELNKKINKLMESKSKRYEVGDILLKPRNDSKGVQKLIRDYFNNYEENFHQIHSLYIYCLGAKKRVSSIEERLNSNGKIIETELNGYYFDLGLLETKVCEKFGTKKDPYWTMLKLARHGNEEMQVFLLEYMILAIHREAINIQIYPDKYLNLRNEAEGYLRKYSHKGVIYATETLYEQYSGLLGKNQLLPTNPVLAYYYAYLADVQNTAAYGYWERDLLKMYDSLTERQQSIVDRMTKNL